MSVLRTCMCLNVSLYLQQQQQDQRYNHHQLPSQLSTGVWAQLASSTDQDDDDGDDRGPGLGARVVRVRHSCLFRCWVCSDSGWQLHSCLNCGQLTHAVPTADAPPGGQRVVAGGDSIVVDNNLLDADAAAAVLISAVYSPWLGIAVLSSFTSPASSSTALSSSSVVLSPELSQMLQRHPSLSDNVEQLSTDLQTYLKKEELRVEIQIAQFREQKLRELKELRSRVSADLHTIARKLVTLESERRAALASERGSKNVSNVSNTSQYGGSADTESGGLLQPDDMGVFVMDDSDFVGVQNQTDTEVEEAGVAVLETAHSPSSDAEMVHSEDSAGSDSGVEAAVNVASVGARSVQRRVHTTSTAARRSMAQSLPVHIPTAATHRDGMSHRFDHDASDRRLFAAEDRRLSDESLPDIEHMGASIHRMAMQSYDNGEGLMYDLPLPRTHTAHGHHRNWV